MVNIVHIASHAQCLPYNYNHAAIAHGEAYNMNYVGIAMEVIHVVLIVRNLFCSWIVSAILAAIRSNCQCI